MTPSPVGSIGADALAIACSAVNKFYSGSKPSVHTSLVIHYISMKMPDGTLHSQINTRYFIEGEE